MPRYIEIECKNCNKISMKEYKRRKTATFCSKGCATSYRQDARDPNFLETPNELSAYLLGFILTDGSISKQDGKKKRMTLANTDFQIMNKLHPIISPNRKLYVRNMSKKEHKTIYSLVNTNEKSLETLEELGIRERKSFDVKMPEIPNDLVRHFIRGVFDGDGSIINYKVQNKYTYKKVTFTSASTVFSESLNDILNKQGFNTGLNKDSRDTNPSFYNVINRTEDIKMLGKWMYEDANWYIERKRNVFFDDIV